MLWLNQRGPSNPRRGYRVQSAPLLPLARIIGEQENARAEPGPLGIGLHARHVLAHVIMSLIVRAVPLQDDLLVVERPRKGLAEIFELQRETALAQDDEARC